MDELEYIVTGALTHCSKGAGVMPMAVTSNTTTHIQKQLVATEQDKTYMINIPNYGMCSTTQKPCNPVPTLWTDTYEYVKVNGSHPLIGKSCLQCAIDPSSKIEFITSGQVPLSICLTPDALSAISEANKAANEASDEYDLERQSVGESGFWEGFIPVWGSGRDYIHSIETKHYWKAAGNLGLVALDVFTLGSDELVLGLVKGGGKGLMEAGGKAAAKKIAAVIAAKEAAILLLKKSAVALSEFSLKEMGICIAKACFATGTIVQTGNGPKNIEDLVSGDEVWAYNEETGETGLKPILNVFERQSDTIVELTIDGEIINTTPEHPFYANSEWKEAGLLEKGDTIQLFNGKAAIVQKVIFKFDKDLLPAITVADDFPEDAPYKPTTVYNIEVEGWHSYFVGLLWLLVHNATCIYQLAKDGVVWAKNIIRGLEFNVKINAEMIKLAKLKNLKYESEVWLKDASGKLVKRLDGLIPGKAIIERKATDLAQVTEETAKSYIRQAANHEGLEIANAARNEGKNAFQGTEKSFLQVQNKEGISDAVKQYAKDNNVTIIDNSDDIFKSIGY